MIGAIVAFLVVFVIGFLLGSIPWGVIVGRVFFKKDPREVGSGNIGTTNSMRALGKVGGIAVFVLDFVKGFAAASFALIVCAACAGGFGGPAGSFLGLDASLAFDAGLINTDNLCSLGFLAAVSGHIFSPWLGWHGGKGIATSIGAIFVAFGWPWALVMIAGFAIVTVLTKYVSAGSLTAAVLCIILSFFRFAHHPFAMVCCLITAALVIWAHRGNIKRLRNGTESRIGKKKENT